jgi:hypothetical protein
MRNMVTEIVILSVATLMIFVALDIAIGGIE